jgi:hypothetical protein
VGKGSQTIERGYAPSAEPWSPSAFAASCTKAGATRCCLRGRELTEPRWSRLTAGQCLKLTDLSHEGWKVVPNTSCALLTPLGAIYLAPPKGRRWEFSAVMHIPLWRVGTIRCCCAMLVAMGLNAFGWAFDYLSKSISKNTTPDPGMSIALLLIEANRLFWSLAFVLQVLRADLPVIRAGRCPMPLVVFNGPGKNILAAVLAAFGAAYLITQIRIDFIDAAQEWQSREEWVGSGAVEEGEQGGGQGLEVGGAVRAWANGLGGTANIVMFAGSLYMLVLSTSFIAWAWIKRGWAQQDVLG